MDLGISGRTALVTAASAGLGLASAQALAAEGVRVAVASRSADKLAAAVATLDGDPVMLTVDLSDPASVDALVGDVLGQAVQQVADVVQHSGGNEGVLCVVAFGEDGTLQHVLDGGNGLAVVEM